MFKNALVIYLIIQATIITICTYGGFNAQIDIAHITGVMTFGVSITVMALSFQVPKIKLAFIIFAGAFLMATGYFLFIFMRQITSTHPLTSIIFDAATTLSLISNIYLIKILSRKNGHY